MYGRQNLHPETRSQQEQGDLLRHLYIVFRSPLLDNDPHGFSMTRASDACITGNLANLALKGESHIFHQLSGNPLFLIVFDQSKLSYWYSFKFSATFQGTVSSPVGLSSKYLLLQMLQFLLLLLCTVSAIIVLLLV